MNFKSKKKNINVDIWHDFYNLQHNSKYVSGTDIKNYILNDCILDYYKERNNSSESSQIHSIPSSYMYMSSTNILFNEGNKFEEQIVKELSKKFQVCTINKQGKNGYTMENLNATIKAMNDKIEIIHSGVLFSEQYGVGGIPDLIVRGDILNKITNNKIINKDEITYSPYISSINDNLSKYYIIDIKWTTIPLCTTENLIRNSGLFGAYKGQLAIYTFLLGLFQGYFPTKAYILGKSWKSDHLSPIYDDIIINNDNTNNNTNNDIINNNNMNINALSLNNSFDLLGVIDYETFDYTYINKTIDGINWIHKIREESKYWKFTSNINMNNSSDISNSFNINELINLYNQNINIFPNVKNSYDTPYSKIKNDCAKKIGEITQLWNVTVNQRNLALSKGIYNIWDNRLSSNVLGISGKNAQVIDAIISINKYTNNLKYKYSSDLFKQLLNKPNHRYFFVDFEFANFADTKDILFMIGVGYINDNNDYIFEQFTCEELTLHEEYKIYKEFLFTINKNIHNNIDYTIIHWGNAEVDIINRLNKRHTNLYNDNNNNNELIINNKLNWLNMYQLFVDNSIVINGSYNFKLKTVANALYSHGLISDKLDENIHNGLDAMFLAINYYKGNKENKGVIKDIMKYNEIDCKLMYDIYKFLLEI